MARGAAARVAAPAPRRAPTRPRRVATPVRRQPASKPLTRGQRIAALPHSPFVDRLLTGRTWIVLVGVLLAGIVFLNVSLLEMNANTAQTSEQVAGLKRENARLRLQAARAGSTERIQEAAADIGLVLPAPGQVRYLKANPAKDPRRALAQMTTPAVAPEPVAVAPEPVPVETVPVAVEPAPVEPVPVEPAPVEAAPVAATPVPTPPPTG